MIDSVKRRYTEARFGISVLAPILSVSNFIMLVFMSINQSIPLVVLAPLMFVALLGLVTIVGNKFRNIQLSTDSDIMYEKQTAFNKTLYAILFSQFRIMTINKMEISPEFLSQLNHVKKLARIEVE